MPTLAEIGLQTSTRASEEVGRRYVKAALHTGFGGVVSRALTGLAPIVLARYLGPGEYGVYALVLALVSIVAGASHLGQNNALQKFLPEYSVKNPRRGGAILADTVVLVSAVLAVVCGAFFFASGWIASAIYHESSLTGVFRFSALLVLFLSLFNLALSAVAGLQNFKAYSKAMVIRSGGFLVLAWAGVWLFGLYGALAGQLLACVFGVAYLTGISIKELRERFPGMVRAAFSRDILGELFSFSFPAFLAGILVAPAYWWANTLLARHAGFAQVGLFGVAFALCQFILVVPNSLSIPAISFMSETHASSEPGRFSALVGANLRLVWALTLPICLGCALFAPWIVRIAFGPAYREAAPLAAIMSFAALVIAVGGIPGNAAAGSGRMWHGLWINVFWLTIFLLAAVPLVRSWGAAGLAVAYVFSYILLAVALTVYSVVILRVGFEGAGCLVALTFLCGLVTFIMFRARPSLPLGAVSLVAELLLVAIEWRVVLTPGERAWLVEFCFRLLKSCARLNGL